MCHNGRTGSSGPQFNRTIYDYGLPAPSFSTPEIFTAIFTPQKARLNQRAVITLCYLANQNL
ncbi:hypothetical protein SB444474_1501 [Shigella boydii 4444-74]|uniref:Uncharacterized protein n=1 Tax=Shigella boydii 4444-74 TaxID=766140 RepID=I6EC73_SHIBO|nr:hypothetical protein SB444474_1501 [Shigella boydii 4444-74]